MEPTTMMGIGSLLSGGAALGGLFSKPRENPMAREQFDQSVRQFNVLRTDQQNAFSHRIHEAKRMGIHPLAAIGAPMAGGGATATVGAPHVDAQEDPLARKMRYLEKFGQNLTRAYAANATLDKRLKEANIRLVNAQAASVEGQGTSYNPSQVGPAVKLNPDQVTRGNIATEGVRPSVSYTKTERGLVPTLSKDLKELVEDSPQELEMQLQNRLLGGTRPRRKVWKKHYPNAGGVEWNAFKGVWEPVSNAELKRRYLKAKRNKPGYKKKNWVPGGP